MRRAFGAVAGLVAAAVVAGTAPTSAQDRPFSAGDLLKGTTATREACAATPLSVFVEQDGRGTCIRYWLSTKGAGKRPVFYFPGDAIVRGPRGEPAADPGYLGQTPRFIQLAADVWAERLGAPVVFFGRVGMHGSSGWHAHRRSRHEVEVTRKAVAAILARHGFTGFHAVGQSGGGLVAAALAAGRSDGGCVALASTPLDFRAFVEDTNWSFRREGWLAHYDPLTEAKRAAAGGARIFVLTDPNDRVVTAAAQTPYAPAVTAAGGKAVQILTAARGEKRHGLVEKAMFLTRDCVAGRSDAEIVKRFAGTGPEAFGE